MVVFDMGGKKKPEINRKYEKDRRDRFNEQFTELHKLLPEFNLSMIKVTKAEIIGKAIEYLKDSQSKNQKLEREFENEKTKISELQKKVAGLLQIVKELIKLLHKSNIGFPSSLPIDDFKSFKDELMKCKRKSKESVYDEKNKKKSKNSESSNSINDAESIEEKLKNTSKSDVVHSEGENQNICLQSSIKTVTVTTSVAASIQQTVSTTQIMNVELPKVLRIDSNSLILPNGNLMTVNGLQNTVLSSVNNSQTLLLNKQVTVPTFILMQNNVVPISTVQRISISQRSQKVIAPKHISNTTKTTFMNKKPIPAVRLYKSAIVEKDNINKITTSKHKRNRRSKGILVKYPKRKPPTKSKKREIRIKKLIKSPKLSNAENSIEMASKKNNTYTDLQSCENVNENSYSTNTEVINKNYSCSDNIFDTSDMQTTRQFIDFLENNSSRCIENNTENVTSAEFTQNTINNNSDKNEKERIDNFNENSFERPFVNTNLNCNLIESNVQKEQLKETETRHCVTQTEKNLNYLPSSSTNDSLLLKYVSNDSSNECATVSSVETNEIRSDNPILIKRKTIEKEIAPLTIHCNLSENKSSPKDLNLSLIDDKKHYESSFDDLFTSLQVPASGQNTDSISPTAAFLHSFPLVSSCKNVDLLPEHEDDSNTTATASMTILQIGNLESPSTLLFTSNKLTNKEGITKNTEKIDDTGFTTYCNANIDLETSRKERNKDPCKDITTRTDGFNLNDVINFKNQPKNINSKESVTQNMSFYPTSTTSSFPSYNIFTKYNDISAVTCSYYSLSSQPFSASKVNDSVTDFNSWIPSVYTQEDSIKDKSKRDKCTLTSFKNTVTNDSGSDRTKNKKLISKQNSIRPLVNWMTSPDLRNVPDTSQQMDIFSLQKEDTINANTFLSSPSIQNNSNFNVSYSSSEYFLENQNYADTQLNNCKIMYSSSNPTNYSWSPSKTTLPSLPIDNHNMIIPSTLPTLVGDLALGNNPSFNNYNLAPKKYDSEKKKETCKNYFKNSPQNSSSFLSVTQLVDDKSIEKTMSKKNMLETNCNFEDERDKCYNKSNYNLLNKNAENVDYCKKPYSSNCKDTKNQNLKCKKDIIKYNHNVTRCISKENKKDTRQLQQKSFNEYSLENCHMLNKDVNSLSNKNSNYSAESLISSSNHQNTCSTQNYFPYDNTTNYSNCARNDYTKKRNEDIDPLTNVGYYANTNYVYPNNFQSLNNYGFSNQCYNNYSSQIQHSTSGFQKKKDENYHTKQDSSDWYKDTFPTYNSIVPTEFASNNQKLDTKCKQSFSNKYNQSQKNGINSESYNKYYQCGSSSSLTTSTTLANTKSSCSFDTTYSFSQVSGQHCPEVNCLPHSYDTKTSSRNSSSINSNNVHPATTFSNFNLSTIFPEINDKHCIQNRVNTIGNEKSNSDYANKVNIDEMNYNYLMQPAIENNAEPPSVYASSSFQIQHFTDFSPRKTHK